MITTQVRDLVSGDHIRLGTDDALVVLCIEELPKNYRAECLGGADTPTHVIVRLEPDRYIILPQAIQIELAHEQVWTGLEYHVYVDNVEGDDANTGKTPEYAIASRERQLQIARGLEGTRVICHLLGTIGDKPHRHYRFDWDT